MVSDYSSNVSEPDLSYTKKAFQNNHSLGGNSTTAETINDIFAQIDRPSSGSNSRFILC
jgi:hypothetical protein